MYDWNIECSADPKRAENILEQLACEAQPTKVHALAKFTEVRAPDAKDETRLTSNRKPIGKPPWTS